MPAAAEDHRRVAGGIAALGAIALLAGGAVAGLFEESGKDISTIVGAFDVYHLRIAIFTLWQALLSTVLSVIPAILVARALSRHPAFPGRRIILRLFAVPLALPALVAALGILALHGRSGLFANLFAAADLGRWPDIYGLAGILMAHVFFNMPLAIRLTLGSLDTIPGNHRRLAAQLGMNAADRFRLIEWPHIRSALPGIAGLVFMLCATSFTIVLILGGGPRSTTLEVAIYQSLRFDFDPAKAVAFTTSQIVLTVIAVTAFFRLGQPADTGFGPLQSGRVYSRPGRAETAFNCLLIVAALLYVGGPMVAIAVAGFSADLVRLAGDTAVWAATATSLVFGIAAASLSLLVGSSLVATRMTLQQRRRVPQAGILEQLVDAGAGFILVIPPVVIGAGWFILLRDTVDVFALAPIMVITVNAAMAMPFVVRVLRPPYDAARIRHDRLCAQLGLKGWNRLRLVDWAVLKRPIATAFAFAMALSLGDLGVIALFGSDAVQTLPYLLFSRLGSYRTADAAGLALLLGLLCMTLMFLADMLKGDR